jgi:hypothetical protein
VRHRFHAICPYFAMFPEHFVRKHLAWSQPGDLIFDPFSGRGTTAFESLLNGRRAAGCDTNDVAVCISRAKTSAPRKEAVLARLDHLENLYDPSEFDESTEFFFQLCFHRKTLGQLLFLRRTLLWREDDTDCFLAALALGCLHGESHRSARYFSNRMPRTISTKPEYSIRWWQKNDCKPPERDVFAILKNEIEYRYITPPPQARAEILRGDARIASRLFFGLVGQVKLVITSPPYLDTTNFAEDQWLRLWFLGEEVRLGGLGRRDDRHTSTSNYWKFLREAWEGTRDLLQPEARLVIRIGGARLSLEEISEGLIVSLRMGLGQSVFLVEQRASPISGGQVRSFQTNVKPSRLEYDFHFLLG